MKPDGISIPSSYTSFISPLQSSKLYGDILKLDDVKFLETPYVVKFRQTYEISEPQDVWKFEHPNMKPMNPLGSPHFNVHNKRYATRRFKSSIDSIMHGVAGYFQCTLYRTIICSILPSTHSKDMFSWFPMFFPLKNPVCIPAGGTVDVHIWRCSDSRKVWYEWSVIPFINGEEIVGGASELHNHNGKSSWIGL